MRGMAVKLTTKPVTECLGENMFEFITREECQCCYSTGSQAYKKPIPESTEQWWTFSQLPDTVLRKYSMKCTGSSQKCKLEDVIINEEELRRWEVTVTRLLSDQQKQRKDVKNDRSDGANWQQRQKCVAEQCPVVYGMYFVENIINLQHIKQRLNILLVKIE